MVISHRNGARNRVLSGALGAWGVFFWVGSASVWAGDIAFGPNDIETVFFINKSDDRNRMDYGLRLDKDCHPVPSDDAIFYYWREFEKAPPVRIHDSAFPDSVAYGLSRQSMVTTSAVGGEYSLKLKRFDREIRVKLARGADGKCTAAARTLVAGVQDARLDSVYVKLGALMSVEFIEVHGAKPDGSALLEKITR